MKKRYAIALIGVLLSGLSLIQPGVSSAATNCPANPTAGSMVVGSMTVNGPCTLDGVTVTGSVTVVTGGALNMVNTATVKGSVNVNGGTIQSQGSAIKGSLVVMSTPVGGANTVCGGTIGGSVKVSGVDGLDMTDSGGYFELGGIIPARCGAMNTRVGGSVTFANNKGYVRVRGGLVGGSVTFTNNTSTFYGAPYGAGDVLSNNIKGSLDCTGNAGAAGSTLVGGGNIAAAKKNQCAGL